ncbi:MAG: hypothetical protein JWN72_2349 [Thermoleophilia bacterium]|nr:hypothetical protein [Thermoleophilia bacterium]
MSIRIRVYPNGGAGAYGGLNGMGGNAYGGVSAQSFFNSKLQAQQQISNLQLQYERALWGERLETTKLKAQMQYQSPLLALQGGLGAFGLGAAGIGGLGGLGGFGLGAVNPYAIAMQSQNNFWGSMGRRF